MKYIKNGIIATAGHGWAEIEKQVPIYEEATEEEMMQEGYEPKIVDYGTITQRVLNATEQMLIDSGYEPYAAPEEEQYTPTYEESVVLKIREKYSIDDELALLRQRDSKPEEFEEYFNHVEQTKKQLK